MLLSEGEAAPAQFGAAVSRSYTTLRRGAHFLGLGLSETAPPRAVHGQYRAKVLGNSLRELDRFLNLLIHEVALWRGIILPREEYNTANKLSRFRGILGLDDPDHARLSALGRSRECFVHCGGTVRTADVQGGTAMTAGWHGDAGLRRFAVGEELMLSPGEMAQVCRFYVSIADGLLADAAARFR